MMMTMMKSNCNGKMVIDGESFNLDSVEIERSPDGWGIEMTADPKRVERWWNEIYQPRISISDIGGKGSVQVGDNLGISADLEWSRVSGFEDDTYVSLLGEGFSLVEACVKIKNNGGGIHDLVISGISDLPTDGKKEFVEISVVEGFEIAPPASW